jgi:hypothetical protein
MKNLFDAATAADVKLRLARLRPDSKRLWGKMNAPQVVAHCSAGLDMATGDILPPRMMIGRLIGGIIKRLALGNDEPMRPNSPTVPLLMVSNERDLDAERTGLRDRIDRFVAKGASGVTKHPHPFFGSLTPEQWAELMYKHLDHHLRQFGV